MSEQNPSACSPPGGRAQTFAQADTAGDGIISPAEWLELVRANPSIIDYMTLPVLKEVREVHWHSSCGCRVSVPVLCPRAVLTVPDVPCIPRMHAGCSLLAACPRLSADRW